MMDAKEISMRGCRGCLSSTAEFENRRMCGECTIEYNKWTDASALSAQAARINELEEALDWVRSGMRDTMPLPESTCKIVDAALDGARKVGG